MLKLKKVFLIVLIPLTFGWCFCYSHKSSQSVQSFELIFNYPVVLSDSGKIRFFNLRDTISIFYQEDYTLYRFLGKRNPENEKKIKGTEEYFIYKKKSINGFLYKTLNDSICSSINNVDSILAKRGSKSGSVDFPTDTIWRYIKTIKNANGNFIKKYAVITSNNLTPDSIFYYFNDNFKGINYSFSPKLDSVENSKLVKIRLLFNEGFSEAQKIVIPKREIYFELKEVPFNKDQRILRMFEKAKKIDLDM